MATHTRKTKRGLINKFGNIEVTETGSEGKTFQLSPAVLTVSGNSDKLHESLGLLPPPKDRVRPHFLSLILRSFSLLF